MKRSIILAALILAAASAWAFPRNQPGYFTAELQAVKAELGDEGLADLKVSSLVTVAERLDLARQKDRYVMAATGLSLAWPGAGQFLAGDWANGTLHTGLHLGITAASLAWAYSVLPDDLRADRLDYFDMDQDRVKAAWKSHHLQDLMPSIGALAAGCAVDLVLRAWSADGASKAARSAVDSGSVAFEPRFQAGHFGMGMRF